MAEKRLHFRHRSRHVLLLLLLCCGSLMSNYNIRVRHFRPLDTGHSQVHSSSSGVAALCAAWNAITNHAGNTCGPTSGTMDAAMCLCVLIRRKAKWIRSRAFLGSLTLKAKRVFFVARRANILETEIRTGVTAQRENISSSIAAAEDCVASLRRENFFLEDSILLSSKRKTLVYD